MTHIYHVAFIVLCDRRHYVFINMIRVHGLDIRVHGLDARVRRLDIRVHGLDARVHGLDARVHGLDARVHGLDARVHGLDARVHGLDIRSAFEMFVNSIACKIKTDLLISTFEVIEPRTLQSSRTLS
jgi:hypothetical protein